MDSSHANPRSQLLRLLRERSLRMGSFTLASGRRSSYYIDARATTMTGLGQLLVGQVGHAAIAAAGWEPDFVGGLTLGADPVAYAIAGHAARTGTPLDAFTVRKRSKGHGAGSGGRVAGCLRPRASVVLVDDTITTGGSVIEAAGVVAEEDVRILGVLVVVDREEGARERLEAAGHDLRALFTAGELLADG